jgi:hypothetical protein
MKKFLTLCLLGLLITSATFASVEDYEMDKEPYVVAAELKALEANDFVPPELPETAEEYAQVFLYMAMNDLFEYDIDLINARFDVATSGDSKDKINLGYDLAGNKYPEYMGYTNRVSYNISSAGLGSKLTIKLYDTDFEEDDIKLMKNLAKLRAKGYAMQLKESGIIKDDMSDIIKAKAIYEWTVWHASYDEDLNRISRTAFGFFDNKSAVCSGYTAAFNMICREFGIDIQAVAGDTKNSSSDSGHMWSLARLEGILVHIDPTWGDPVGDHLPEDYISYDYFALEPKMMKEDHIWDDSIYGE